MSTQDHVGEAEPAIGGFLIVLDGRIGQVLVDDFLDTIDR